MNIVVLFLILVYDVSCKFLKIIFIKLKSFFSFFGENFYRNVEYLSDASFAPIKIIIWVFFMSLLT